MDPPLDMDPCKHLDRLLNQLSAEMIDDYPHITIFRPIINEIMNLCRSGDISRSMILAKNICGELMEVYEVASNACYPEDFRCSIFSYLVELMPSKRNDVLNDGLRLAGEDHPLTADMQSNWQNICCDMAGERLQKTVSSLNNEAKKPNPQTNLMTPMVDQIMKQIAETKKTYFPPHITWKIGVPGALIRAWQAVHKQPSDKSRFVDVLGDIIYSHLRELMPTYKEQFQSRVISNSVANIWHEWEEINELYKDIKIISSPRPYYDFTGDDDEDEEVVEAISPPYSLVHTITRSKQVMNNNTNP